MAMVATKAKMNPYAPTTAPQSQSLVSIDPAATAGTGNGGTQDMFGRIRGQATVASGVQSTDPYRSDLQTSFQGKYDPGSSTYNNSYSNDSDSDVRVAQALTDDLSRAHRGQDQGMDQVATQAQLDAILARIGQKNAIGSSIKANAGMENQAENQDRWAANDALGQGIKNTRQNFNNRGLLYSGLRQGGEDSVRSGVASKLGSDLANTKRDYSNLAQSQKEAYAALGQQQEQQRLDRANETFDTVTKNNVARAQAYQQLGQGLGGLAGAYAGSQRPQTPQQSSIPNNYSEGLYSAQRQGGGNSYISPD